MACSTGHSSPYPASSRRTGSPEACPHLSHWQADVDAAGVSEEVQPKRTIGVRLPMGAGRRDASVQASFACLSRRDASHLSASRVWRPVELGMSMFGDIVGKIFHAAEAAVMPSAQPSSPLATSPTPETASTSALAAEAEPPPRRRMSPCTKP